MAMVGQMMKPKKTEITDKLRQEINKVSALLGSALNIQGNNRGCHNCVPECIEG
jgi:hypothetical protein